MKNLWVLVSYRLSHALQSVVPDLSYTVRSPMLDTWEGIKQLKAALWALVSPPNHSAHKSQRCMISTRVVSYSKERKRKTHHWFIMVYFLLGRRYRQSASSSALTLVPTVVPRVCCVNDTECMSVSRVTLGHQTGV